MEMVVIKSIYCGDVRVTGRFASGCSNIFSYYLEMKNNIIKFPRFSYHSKLNKIVLTGGKATTYWYWFTWPLLLFKTTFVTLGLAAADPGFGKQQRWSATYPYLGAFRLKEILIQIQRIPTTLNLLVHIATGVLTINLLNYLK